MRKCPGEKDLAQQRGDAQTQDQRQIIPLGYHRRSYDKIQGLALINRAKQHRQHGKYNATQHKRKHDGAVVVIFGEPSYAQISHARHHQVGNAYNMALHLQRMARHLGNKDQAQPYKAHRDGRPRRRVQPLSQPKRRNNRQKNGIRLLVSYRLRQSDGSNPIEKEVQSHGTDKTPE